MKKTLSMMMVLSLSLLLVGCSGYYDGSYYNPKPDTFERGETYAEITENPFILTEDMPTSTFSSDVDTASYTNIRRMLNDGYLPEKNAIRIEEMVNYFSYDFDAPDQGEGLKMYHELSNAPWHEENKLLMIGLKAEEIVFETSVGMNLVFLIDVSGSMYATNKLPLLKQALNILVDNLRPIDRISIVVYAGAAGVIIEGADSTDKADLKTAINGLEAGGSTAGGAGIHLAYDVANRNFIEGGNNRIILASDGDFNVGMNSTDELIELIEAKRETGVYLSVLGFGGGNLRDDIMESLADHGNGVYYYIDNIKEAEKVFVHQLGATMITVAKDAKIQIEFNPQSVKAYRLIGYENRLLNNEDFNDDQKDAGDIGSGHVVVAFYEIVPTGSEQDISHITFDDSYTVRYDGQNHIDEFAILSLRYKNPTDDTAALMQQIVYTSAFTTTPSNDFKFASAVIEFGLLLRDSTYKGQSSYTALKQRAMTAIGMDTLGYRSEFVELVEIAKNLSSLD